jgi:hypothetical protein
LVSHNTSWSTPLQTALVLPLSLNIRGTRDLKELAASFLPKSEFKNWPIIFQAEIHDHT